MTTEDKGIAFRLLKEYWELTKSNNGMMNAVYFPESTRLRQEADRIDRKEALEREIREFLKANS